MPLSNRQTGDEKVQQGQRRDAFFKRLKRRASRLTQSGAPLARKA